MDTIKMDSSGYTVETMTVTAPATVTLKVGVWTVINATVPVNKTLGLSGTVLNFRYSKTNEGFYKEFFFGGITNSTKIPYEYQIYALRLI